MVTRLKRVVLHRLLPLVAAVVLGTAGAVFWTNASNAAIRPTFQAVAMAGLPAPRPKQAPVDPPARFRTVSPKPRRRQSRRTPISSTPIHLILSTLSTQDIDFTVTAGTTEEAAEEAAAIEMVSGRNRPRTP